MRIFVDSDACPVKEEILAVAREKGVEVLFVVSTAGYSNRDWGVTQILVDKLPQAVDIAIINRMEAGDIVVTQDYGLALLVLGKKGQAISPRGTRFHDGNMDRLLQQRQMNYDARKAGMRIKGPKKLTAQDRARFQEVFRSLIERQEGV